MIKVGVVGAGIRGDLFARALSRIPGAKLAAVCDPRQERADALSRTHAVPAFSSYEALLSGAELDALVIATPDFAHKDIAIAGAKRGLHLMVEKPIATTLEDAYAIRAAVQQAGVKCMTAFENRWHPAFLHAHKLAKAGELGNMLTQNITLSNSYFVPTSMIGWAAQSSPGWFLMSHTTDLALWLSGKRVKTVYARGSRGVLAARGVDTWDVINAILTFEDGTTVNLSSTWVLPDASPAIVEFRYHAVGERSSISYELGENAMRQATPDKFSTALLVGAEVNGYLQAPPVWMLDSFIRQLGSDEPMSPGIDDGVRVTEVMVAIHESLADGTEKTLPR